MIDANELGQLYMDAPIGICILDGPEHTFILANCTYMDILFGRDRELVGKPIREALPELAGQGFYELCDNVYRTGVPFAAKDFPAHVIKSGVPRDIFVNFTYQARRNSQGEIVGIFVIVTDVTDQVQKRRHIEEDANLLRLITDRLPAFVSYMDTDLRYRFVNRVYSDWFELPASEIEGKTRADLVDDRGTYQFMSPYEKKAFAGEAVSFELTLTRPDGRFVNLDTEYLPDIDPETGKVRGIIGVGQDITERRRTLLAIEASESRYRSLTDTIPQLMWTSNAEGLVNYANERCLQYTGLSTQEKYGQGWVTALHPDDRAQVGAAWRNSMEAGNPFKEEYRLKRADGEYRWFLGRAIPIRLPDGAIQYWIGTATDIEDEKRSAEELTLAKEIAENANRTKSAFLANMSHEIRTPLGVILGFSALLKDDSLSHQEREHYIDTIDRNGQSLTRIIDDILDLAKVEAGSLDVEEVSVEFFDLLNEVTELFREKAREKGIQLSLVIEPSVPRRMSSDPTRLRQILINIIGNAVKFTDAGGVSIRARAEATSQENAGGTTAGLSGNMMKVTVEVKDTGCGLNADQNERLFKPFTQADNTTTRRFGGTGLGLALSKRLSEALGGDISIAESIPGKGSTFVICFRAKKAEALRMPVTNLSSIAAAKPLPLTDVRILLVDDSLDNQYLVKRVLMKNGALVDVAGNGREAVEAALSKPHDIVLMDIQMPEMDGYQAASALLAKGYKTPIIALTAHAMMEERAKTHAAGFAGHLTKPIDTKELLETISRQLKDGPKADTPTSSPGVENGGPSASLCQVTKPRGAETIVE